MIETDFRELTTKNKMMYKFIFKILIILFISFVLLFTSGCLESKKAVTIKAEIIENDIPQITNVETNSVLIDELKYPKDIPPNFPGVYVLIIYKNNRINYWTSVPYTGPGTYELTSGLRFIPDDGEEAKVIVTVNNDMGDRIAMNTTAVTI